MTDVELETRNFLRELDTFGQPPPPQRLISDADNRTMSKEFELKLHHINLEKQKHVRSSTWSPKPGTSSNNKSSVNKNGNGNPAENSKKNEMSKEEISKLKEQVVSASRPLNPWYEHQHQSPILSTNFVRSVVRKGLNEEEKHLSPIATNTPIRYNHIDVATVSGENTVPGVLNAKKSNCAQNAASISPASASSNTETSHSSISMSGSSTSNSIDPNEDTYRATPCAASSAFRGLISPAKTYYHSGLPIRRRSRVSP
ncbi:unnamed protein product [Onchocerca ochengi]|uniref:ZM domain-containing protein n=1 Tax=Onchocerca ochengi TaxID=42157 RepID=A0A182ETW5_ONCOC|nr:unnamed protein product [Onchocerca ochengi]